MSLNLEALSIHSVQMLSWAPAWDFSSYGWGRLRVLKVQKGFVRLRNMEELGLGLKWRAKGSDPGFPSRKNSVFIQQRWLWTWKSLRIPLSFARDSVTIVLDDAHLFLLVVTVTQVTLFYHHFSPPVSHFCVTETNHPSSVLGLGCGSCFMPV